MLANPTYHQHGHNPLCGDKLTVYVQAENGVINDVRFEGAGCAISVASASLMTDAVKNKPLEQILNLFEHFHQLVTTGKESEIEMGKLAVFSGVAEFPIRVKCATLAWHTLKAALQQEAAPVSTE